MKNELEYKLVTSSTTHDFNSQVSRLLRKGWQPAFATSVAMSTMERNPNRDYNSRDRDFIREGVAKHLSQWFQRDISLRSMDGCGDGWRIMKVGEAIELGDEYDHDAKGWTPTVMIGNKISSNDNCQYRRKVSQ